MAPTIIKLTKIQQKQLYICIEDNWQLFHILHLFLSLKESLITKSNHDIVQVADVGAVDNDEEVSAQFRTDDQLALVQVERQLFHLLKCQTAP